MLDTAELLHFRLPALRAGTLLVCVSQSGESAELVRLIEALPASRAPERPWPRSPTAPQNTLAAAADDRDRHPSR